MTLHLIAETDLPPCGVTPPLVGGGFKPAGYLPAPDSGPDSGLGVAPKHRPQTRAAKGKTDLYQSVTDTVINQLEAGVVPWVQPWGRPDAKTPFGLPTNADTGNAYSGIGILKGKRMAPQAGANKKLNMNINQ